MNSHVKKRRTGLVFKRGTLYSFEESHVLIVRGGKRPQVWIRRGEFSRQEAYERATALLCEVLTADYFLDTRFDNKILAQLPDGQRLLPGVLDAEVQIKKKLLQQKKQHRQRILLSCLKTLPADYVKRMRRYGTCQWKVALVLARCPGALDLSRSSPALLLALAHHELFCPPPTRFSLRMVRRLLLKKQKDILGCLGFPATDPMRRLFQKLDVYDLRVQDLLELRAVQENLPKFIAHFPRLNSGMLQIASSPRYLERVSPRLLAELSVSAAPHATHVVDILDDTLKMAETAADVQLPEKFHSYKRLMEVHEECVLNVNALYARNRWIFSAPFPSPPYKGTDTICPILTTAELYQEGYEMMHCAQVHTDKTMAGQMAFYKVLAPVRATLSLCWDGQVWQFDEMEGARNTPVARQVKLAILEALFNSPRTQVQGGSDNGLVDEMDLRQLPFMTPEMKAAYLMVRKIFGDANSAA